MNPEAHERLPIAHEESRPAPLPFRDRGASMLRGLLVAVVENDRLARDALCSWLQEEGARVAGASSLPQLREVIWVQEEPRNMGAWSFAQPRLRALLGELPLRYEGRPERASPAEGYAHRHAAEQLRIVRAALTAAPALAAAER